ncbi:MAG: hypothetical protein GEV10_18740 [Streptosporangiales bacterium]|nr:hypothetical protein [Streptosporangiales bacterium]
MRKPRRFLSAIALLTALSVTSGCGGAGSMSETLVLASSANTNITMGRALQHFAKLVDDSGAGLEVETHLDGSLFSEATAINAVQNSEADLATISDGNYGAFGDGMFFMNLPYVFKDRDTFKSFILDSDAVEDVHKQVEEETGLVVVALLENSGFRWLGQNKLVRSPSDMGGVRYRTVDSPVEVDLIKAWGGSPTPIAWAETYNALSQGVVDGVHSLYDWSETAGHFESVSHVTEVNAVIGVHLLLMDRNRFDDLTDGQQRAVRDAGSDTEAWIIEQDTQANQKARREVSDQGVKIYQPNASEEAQWLKRGLTVREKYKDRIPRGLLDGIESLS